MVPCLIRYLVLFKVTGKGKALMVPCLIQYHFKHSSIIWWVCHLYIVQLCVLYLNSLILFNCLNTVLHIGKINCYRVVSSPSYYDDNDMCWSPWTLWLRPLYIIHALTHKKYSTNSRWTICSRSHKFKHKLVWKTSSRQITLPVRAPPQTLMSR